jgi:hypothetical protein
MNLIAWKSTEDGVRDLLKFLMLTYGQKFTDLWRGVTPGEMKAVWSMALSGYTSDEIQRGLKVCMTHIWPPTLPEFLMWCRPPMDYEVAFVEAVNQMRNRDDGSDTWSQPAIYWAAVEFGAWDLRQATWDRVKARWTRILEEQLAKSDLPPVPQRMDALPAPGKAMVSVEKVREQLDALRLRMGVERRVSTNRNVISKSQRS